MWSCIRVIVVSSKKYLSNLECTCTHAELYLSVCLTTLHPCVSAGVTYIRLVMVWSSFRSASVDQSRFADSTSPASQVVSCDLHDNNRDARLAACTPCCAAPPSFFFFFLALFSTDYAWGPCSTSPFFPFLSLTFSKLTCPPPPPSLSLSPTAADYGPFCINSSFLFFYIIVFQNALQTASPLRMRACTWTQHSLTKTITRTLTG